MKTYKKIALYTTAGIVLGSYAIGVLHTKSWNPRIHLQTIKEGKENALRRDYLMKALDVAADENGNGKPELDEEAKKQAFLDKIKREKPSLKELEVMVRNYQ